MLIKWNQAENERKLWEWSTRNNMNHFLINMKTKNQGEFDPLNTGNHGSQLLE